MDPLSEVLRSVRLTGGVFLESHFTAPWSVLAKLEAEDCQFMSTPPVQIIAYHFVVDGSLFVVVDDEGPIRVRAGEVILLPRNDPHTLCSAPDLSSTSARALVQSNAAGGLPHIMHGGGGEPAHIICGYLASTELHNPLIASLPRMLTLDVQQGTSRDWVGASVRFAADELRKGRFATSSIMSRLSESLLVESVRKYAATLGDHEAGWLKGAADPQIGRTLALMHRDVHVPWTAEALAKEAALSRSAFVDRFTTLVGMPPIRYLTTWRLQTAKLSLSETRMTIAQLAHSVGYESEEAFSRAFKREFGLSPMRWRDSQTA